MADRASRVKIENALGQIINPASEEAVDVLDYIYRIDQADSTTIYIGKSSATALVSEAVWRISKVDTTSYLTVTFADGNGNYDNVWNNRASLSYS